MSVLHTRETIDACAKHNGVPWMFWSLESDETDDDSLCVWTTDSLWKNTILPQTKRTYNPKDYPTTWSWDGVVQYQWTPKEAGQKGFLGKVGKFFEGMKDKFF